MITSRLLGERCPTCHSGSSKEPKPPSTDVSLLTAIDGAVGQKMNVWFQKKQELESQLEKKSKELNSVVADSQIRERALKKEVEESKTKLERKLKDLDDQVRAFRIQCECKIKEEQSRSSRLHEELTREVTQREAELSKAKTRLSESGKTIGILETERVKLSNDFRECRVQKEALQTKVKELLKEKENLKTTSSQKNDSVRLVEDRYHKKIADAERRATDQERLVSEHMARIESLQKALTLSRQVQKQTVDDKRKFEEDLSKKEYDVKRLTAELDGTKLALVRLTSEHSTCACRITDLQKSLNSLKLSKTANTVSSSEQKTLISDLRRQINQLNEKLESANSERKELSNRIAEEQTSVLKWHDNCESLKAEINSLTENNRNNVDNLKQQITQFEALLKKSTSQEAQWRSQLQQGINKDSNTQHQLESIRRENNSLRVELSEAHQRIDSLIQERASLFDQLADNGRLRFELEQMKRKLNESVEETKMLKKLNQSSNSENKRPSELPSPTVIISPLAAQHKSPMMSDQAVSLLSADSPTFVGRVPSTISFVSHNNHNQITDGVSMAPTSMTTPAFRNILLGSSGDNVKKTEENASSHTRPTSLPKESRLSASYLTLIPNEDIRSKSSQSSKSQNNVIADEEPQRDLSISNFSSSFFADWEKHSAKEAKSLEAALSNQINALTAASEKILSKLCSDAK